MIKTLLALAVIMLTAEAKTKPCDIECTLTCTLFEFYNGSLKTLKYTSD